jgi:hypothetical protein
MLTISYRSAIEKAADLSPSLDKPGEFIKWAEDIAELISAIYITDYDQVTEDLLEAAKNEQEYDDVEDDDGNGYGDR